MEFTVVKLFDTLPVLNLKTENNNSWKVYGIRIILQMRLKNNQIFDERMVKIIKRAGGKFTVTPLEEFVDLSKVENVEKLLNQLNEIIWSIMIIEKLIE